MFGTFAHIAVQPSVYGQLPNWRNKSLGPVKPQLPFAEAVLPIQRRSHVQV